MSWGWGPWKRFGQTIEAQRFESNCSRERFRASKKGQGNYCPQVWTISKCVTSIFCRGIESGEAEGGCGIGFYIYHLLFRL
jgi:hypothetical protein